MNRACFPSSDYALKVDKAILPNGLRLVHHYIPDISMVALDIIYHVGAVNESPELTGIAHLFEHLMFGGSQNIDDFDGVLTTAGGVNNAWTSNDFTNFYEVAPAHNAETLFYLESDRLLNPTISQAALDVQRSVVIEEFKQQCLNRPYGDMSHTLRSMVYRDHPYSWPVIGKDFSGLEKVTRDDMRQWWENNYTPQNAVLAVSGNISFERTYELALKWFGNIPARMTKQKPLPEISDLAKCEVRTVTGNVPATLITVAYLMDGYGTRRYYAADAITDILSAGQASRFFQRIAMNPRSPVVDADASITGSLHRGMLMLSARLADENNDLDEARNYLVNVARSIITEGVSERELQRLKNKQLSSFVLNNMACTTSALTVAEAELVGESPETKIDRYLALTVDDIVDEAERLFNRSNPAIVYYRPNSSAI